MKIEVICGDIVAQPDAMAIVNSANTYLRPSTGLAGAIHNAAGPQLADYCAPFAPLKLGTAMISPGFLLPNPWVIHTCAAHYHLEFNATKIMADALHSMLKMACEKKIRSLAIPAIGIGVFQFPLDLAAQMNAKALFSPEWKDSFDWVRFCVSSPLIQDAYSVALLG
jgi:hypothetical protein